MKSKHFNFKKKNQNKQECIPVGCVPAARRPYAGVCFPAGRGWVSAPGGGGYGLVPGGVCSRGVWSRGVSALGGLVLGGVSAPGGLVPGGLLRGGCSGGVWSRRRGVSALGGLVQGGCLLWGGSPCLGEGGFSLPGDPSPVNRITHTCKNITLATTSLRPVKTSKLHSRKAENKQMQKQKRDEETLEMH